MNKKEKQEYDKAYYKANKGKWAAYCEANKGKMAAYQKAYYKANKNKKIVDAVNRHLRNKYGITPAEKQKMVEEQNGLCLICHKPLGTGKGVHIDHDHDTGRVRGVLCTNCNSALGLMKDDPGTLQNAIQYLLINNLYDTMEVK